MSITNVTELRLALLKAQHVDYQIKKTLDFTPTSQFWYSPLNVGSYPGIITIPDTTGIIPTNSTAGFLPFSNYSGNTNYILSAEAFIDNNLDGSDSEGSKALLLYDTLFINGGLACNQTGTVDLGCPAVDRPNGSGSDNELWLVSHLQLVAGTGLLNITYTNQDGVTGRTTSFLKDSSVNADYARVYRLILQSGDSGVRRLESYGWSSPLSSAGNFGFIIARPVTTIYTARCASTTFDWYHLGMPIVYDNAALGFLFLGGGGASVINGKILIGNG